MRGTILMASASLLILSTALPTRAGLLARLADRYAGHEIHHGGPIYSNGYTQGLDYGGISAPPAVEASAYAVPTEQGGEPYGFLAILNNYRASMGLRPVALDPSLSDWASRNNAAQNRRGIGHHINPNCFQNCGWNYANAASVFQGWLNSPGHRQNMLAPNIHAVGIAHGPGPYWTMNAR